MTIDDIVNVETIRFAGKDYLVAMTITGGVLVGKHTYGHVFNCLPFPGMFGAYGFNSEYTAEAKSAYDQIGPLGNEQCRTIYVGHLRYKRYRSPDDGSDSGFLCQERRTEVVARGELRDGVLVDCNLCSGMRKLVEAAAKRLDEGDRVFEEDPWM